MPTNHRWSAEFRLSDEDRLVWSKLLDTQYGTISYEQLRDLRIAKHVIRANLDAGRWCQVLPRVYSVFTGTLTRPAMINAAMLYGGPYTLLSHRTAAEEWGILPVSASGPVHITAPYRHSAVSHPPLVHVHRSRAFHHILTATEPPRTSREDTLLDLAAAETTAVAARDTLIRLVGSTQIALWRLHGQLECRPPRRHRKALKQALELLTGGSLSVLESEYTSRVERAHGIPTAQRQVPFVVDDLVLWEDVVYDGAGVPLTVRLDGRRFHSSARTVFRDRRRDNAAELLDRPRLVYGWHEVHNDPCGVAGEVLEVLTREGWGGRGHCCTRECTARF